MNRSTLFGFLFAVTIFVIAVMMSLKNYMVLLSTEAALLVLGGTATVALICIPAKRLVELFKVLFGQQNLWVNFGTGRSPSLWYKATSCAS